MSQSYEQFGKYLLLENSIWSGLIWIYFLTVSYSIIYYKVFEPDVKLENFNVQILLIIAKTRKHMGIAEAIQEEVIRQGILEGEDMSFERKLQVEELFAIKKMNKKGFSIELIADILEISVCSVEQGLKITPYL